MHNLVFTLTFLFYGATTMFSQTIVQGVLTEFETGETLPFCQVTVKADNPKFQPEGFQTDLEGKYSFPLNERVRYISFSYVGFMDTVVDLADLYSMRKIKKGTLPDTLVLNISMQSNMAPPGMPPVIIIAHTDMAGDANRLTGGAIQRQTGASLGEVLNTIPGLQFDERGLGGSRRISLRGSMLRSPFGVRNVRVYYNEASLSSPDGSTPLELIEARQLGEVKVWKGPQGSWSGPGHGGRIDFSSPILSPGTRHFSGHAGLATGSFGLLRGYAGLNWKGANNKQYRIQYTRQQYSGYREQEGNQKDQVEIHFHLPIRKRHVLIVDGWLFDGEWELPGGQEITDFQNNPRAALPYSATAQAAVYRRRSRLSLGHKWYPADRFEIQTSAYGNLTDKKNPYGSSPFFQGYKDENSKGIGARSKVKYNLYKARYAYVGGEYQIEDNRLDEFDNQNGQPAGQRFSAQTISRHWLAYTGLDYRRGFQKLEARIGLDQTDYQFADLLLNENKQGYGIKPVLLPDLTYSVTNLFNYQWNLLVHFGTGYSPPTVWELLDQQGNPNLDLEPERSQTIEVKFARARFGQLPNRLLFEVNAFYQQTRNALVPRNLVNGAPYFENVGVVNLRGFEWYLSKSFPFFKLGLKHIRLWGTATTQLANFGAFESSSGQALEGLQVPGLARLRSNAHLEIAHKKNHTLELQWAYQGKMALDEANTVFQDGFSLFNLKLKADFVSYGMATSYPARKVERFAISPFAGINNLLDARYNAFPVLNAARGRYYNAGAGRSFYGGVDVRF